MVKTRDPLPPPLGAEFDSSLADEPRRVLFRHPAYPDNAPELLALSAVDDDLGEGIDYDTALLTCSIVACNSWHHAWLGEKQTPPPSCPSSKAQYVRVDRPSDGILRGPTYYFFISSNTDEKYPVVPSFDHWRFPHDDLPPLWQSLAGIIGSLDAATKLLLANTNAVSRPAVQLRDRTCRITHHREACEAAHLVPSSHGSWFLSNGMHRYCRRPSQPNPVDDDRNLVLLRRDLHKLFDSWRFAFVPKQTAAAAGSDCSSSSAVCFVVHVLLPQTHRELHALYHNRALQPLADVSAEVLLARFAWSILTDENYRFLKGMQQYAVALFNPETGAVEHKTLNAAGVRALAQLFGSPARTRSVSPQKRKQDDVKKGPVADDEQEDWPSSDEEAGSGYPPRGMLDNDDDDSSSSGSGRGTRGRPRRRSPQYYAGRSCCGEDGIAESPGSQSQPSLAGAMSFSTVSASSAETTSHGGVSPPRLPDDAKDLEHNTKRRSGSSDVVQDELLGMPMHKRMRVTNS